MTPDFQALLLDGIFYEHHGHVMVADVSGTQDVFKSVERFEGHKVLVALHYTPGPDVCLWKSLGDCPVGHHNDPNKLLNFRAKGIVHRDCGQWIIMSEGVPLIVPLAVMNGHRGRMIIVSVLDSDKPDQGNVEGLRAQVEAMRDVLAHIVETGKGDT